MKKITLFIFAFLTVLAAQATDLTGVKIYINPGHGGYNGNDRSIWTIPVPETWSNPAGYWESKSNLVKGLALKEMLESAGATVIISRTENTSGVRDGAQYAGGGDRDLSEIAEEANANNVDHFLSIHSNALNTTTNYLLLLYHGYDGNPTVAASLPMAQSSGPIQINNPLTVWTSSSPILRGDFTFYGDNLGLGVLRPLTVPGFLSEGSFHDYPPETHRLCSNDYCRLEAMRLFKHFNSYFQRDMPQAGTIAGFVKSGNELVDVLEEPKFTYKSGSDDQWLPLNGVTVKLLSANGSVELATTTTDNWYNGIFSFYGLASGNYKLSFSLSSYETKTVDVTVTPGEITYAKTFLKNVNIVIPDYPEPEQGEGATALSNYDFVADGTAANPSWLSKANIKRVLYRNDKLYVLTTAPKIFIVNATTLDSIGEMNLTGIEGGSPIVSDIAFTADGYLLACNKETIVLDTETSQPTDPLAQFKVYMWSGDNAVPALLFQSQKQGNWSGASVGETFAVSGSYQNLKVYYTAMTTAATDRRYRIIGLTYRDETHTVTVSKYMGGNADAYYNVSEWGEHPIFTISPSGSDYILIDSELLPPTEYQFNWSDDDRSSLVKKGTLNAAEVPAVATGCNFFRYAKHTFMAAPACNTDLTQVGVALFDVTDGLDNAVKISDKYPTEGLGATPATYMMAGAKVDGYNIRVLVLAKGEGIARFKSEISPVANIYASELSITNEKAFKFTLNENASSVFINIYKDGESIDSYSAGALAKGVQTIANPFGSKEYNAWSVTASARPVGYPAKISDDSPVFQFYSARGVAVDNNPESLFFGRVYVAESAGGLMTAGTPVNPRTSQKGIYILDAALTDVTNQGAKSYTGGVAWGTNSGTGYQYAPRGITTDATGKVYITDSSFGNSGVYIMSPADPAATFSSMFGGTINTTNGQVKEGTTFLHNPIEDCEIIGKGTETRLFTYDRPASPVAGGIYRYDIGQGTLPWTVAPSATVYDDTQNGNRFQNGYGQIASDARGGWWICQYRAGSGGEAVPALVHETSGTLDYNCGTTLTSSYQGAMAVNADGTLLAMATKGGTAEVFEVAYDASNKPTLTQKYSIGWGTSSQYLQNAAFDAAGNLYLVSNYNERLMVYALPKVENSYTTHVSLSTGTGINTVESPNDCITIYPNPVKTEINIHVNRSGLLLKSYAIYDLKGMAVGCNMMNVEQTKIDIRNLTPGMYLLQVITSEGLVNKRIIKQ